VLGAAGVVCLLMITVLAPAVLKASRQLVD
jgi:hypothetical protein